MNNRIEIEILLRKKQAEVRKSLGVPQYILYWGDESVTSEESVSSLMAATQEVVEKDSQRLLAYLTPHGCFQVTKGGWVGGYNTCPICGNNSVVLQGGRVYCYISSCFEETNPTRMGFVWVSVNGGFLAQQIEKKSGDSEEIRSCCKCRYAVLPGGGLRECSVCGFIQ